MASEMEKRRRRLEVANVLNIEKSGVHAWTDSTVVLAWLNSQPCRWKTYVANRVSEILTGLDPQQWAHVATIDNPADCASRRTKNLEREALWKEGPSWLKQNEIIYHRPGIKETNLEERTRKVFMANLDDTKKVGGMEEILARFSSLTRMTRVMAYSMRFVNKLKGLTGFRDCDYLSTEEISGVLNLCIRQLQERVFSKEIAMILRKDNLPKGNSLRSLNPYLDENKILRVGGRLEHSQLSENRKHPILIPKRTHLGTLIVADAHSQTLHGGPRLMLGYIQAKYCIIGAKQLIKEYFRKCVTCLKNQAATQAQLMGQLPAARVTPVRPFKCSGVDYAGPIQIRAARGRGHKSYKGYICLFICMVTRAVHLEVVSDLTSEGFLQAFKRFVARRGYCSDLWSDNGTNFVGAAKEMKRLLGIERTSFLPEVAENLATNGCTWHFIPSRAPHFGGLWEAGIKSVKYHLKRVVGESTLTFEEMSTVLAQVEACLNSRPLSVISSNDDIEEVLTPGHFLVGEALLTPPERNFEDSNISSLRRWQYAQKMLQDFWRRWSKDYLSKFHHRYQWSAQNPELKIGDVVVVKEDSLPASRWMYGKVIATHPGLDKIVRVVTLKVKNGSLKRPVNKLCLLPTAE